MSRSAALVLLPVLALSGAACGGGPGDPNKLKNGGSPTAGMGLSTDVVDTYAEPLIVDWNPNHRTDLEVMTRDKIAVVRYQKNEIKLLKDCYVDGAYGYVGVTKKEQFIRYDSSDELAANLPGIFALGGAKLGAEMEQGTTVDIGLVIVGKRTAVRTNAQRSELQGDCTGATHFVRGATIGAFAVQTGERSKMGSVAGLFGAGVSAKSASSRSVSNKDGSIDKCSTATTEQQKAPEGCGSLLRLELRPFDAPKKAAKDEKGNLVKSADIPECSAGFVWDGAKCAKKGSAKAFACSGKDEAQCRDQCDKQNAKSCTQLALIYRNAGKDPPQAVAFFKKACGLGDESACAEFGSHLLQGSGIQKDEYKALETFQKACTAGDGLGCSFLGRMFRSGTATEPSESKAFGLFKRACDGGLSQGCVELGTMHEQGIGTTRDYKKAIAYYQRACKADNPDGCAQLGIMYASGRGVELDRQKSIELFKNACDKNSAVGCTELGNTYFRGAGMERKKENDEEAARLYEKACGLWGGAEGCARLGYLTRYGWGVKMDGWKGYSLIEKGCQQNSGYACVELGKIYETGALGKPRDSMRAIEYYQRSCDLFEGEGCRLIGLIYRNGQGVQVDNERAHEYFARGCRTGHPRSCYHVAADLYTGTGTKVDYAKAMSHYEHSCSGGFADSCNEVGFLYDHGQGVKEDKQKAAALFDQGCELGSSTACENLGKYIESGVYKASSKDRALALYAQACDKGDPASCHRLAQKYQYGSGFAKDPVKAVSFYRKGCDRGYYQACMQLGDMYRFGFSGISASERDAFGFYSRACSGRLESACDAMAELYVTGKGVGANPTEAARIRQGSCERGNTKSCRSLAKMYVEGVGVAKDPKAAAQLHEKACYLRSSQDCYELALLYDKGEGVKADGKKTAEFFQRACNFGSTLGCANMGYFIYKGSAEQKKDTTLGLAKLRYGCTNFASWYKDEKEKVKNVWACAALKKLNQKLDAPDKAPAGTPPPVKPALPPLGGTQKM